MKTVQEIMANISTTAPQGGSGQKLKNEERAEGIWQMMGSMFGHRWVSSFGQKIDPDRAWIATLMGVTDEQIKNGFRALSIRGDEWPPTAPEFRKLCLNPENKTWEQQGAAYREYRPEKLLTKITQEELNEIAKKNLEEMKKMLGESQRRR